MRRRALGSIAVAAVVLATGGCALTSKSRPADVHLFTPEALDAPPRATAAKVAKAAPAHPMLVRLGRVTSSAHLRTRIVVRHANHELRTYDQERWTEAPEAYVRRAVERALFDDARLARGFAGSAPAVDLEITAFEEVRRGAAVPSGRVEIAFVLHDERDVLASGQLEVERPSTSEAMGDVVAAIGSALDSVAAEIAREVARHLAPEATSRE